MSVRARVIAFLAIVATGVVIVYVARYRLASKRPNRSLVLERFQAPFKGTFRLSNVFDHNMPLQFEDTNGVVIKYTGERVDGIDGHNGYDWVMPVGTPIFAVADGTVLKAEVDPPFECPPLGRRVSDQRFIEIQHDIGKGIRLTSTYVHLSRFKVKAGMTVRAGELIGWSGNSGCSTEPHLHFSVWRLNDTNSGRPARIDPFGWLGKGVDPWSIHPQGAKSIWLWKRGHVPPLSRR